MRVLPILLVAALVFAACSDGEAEGTTSPPPVETSAVTTASPAVTTTTAAAATTSTTAPAAATDPGAGSVPDLTVFISSLTNTLQGTGYATAPLDDPEVFVATGQLFCELLDSGMDPDAVMTEYIADLTGGSIDDADDDDLVLAGALLGVSIGVLCPQHVSLLEG